MRAESASILYGSVRVAIYRLNNSRYILFNFGFYDFCKGVVVSCVTLFLHRDEHVGEILDFVWKQLDFLTITASVFGKSVFEGSVGLTPRSPAARCTSASDQ
jgi:hypothetical protein